MHAVTNSLSFTSLSVRGLSVSSVNLVYVYTVYFLLRLLGNGLFP